MVTYHVSFRITGLSPEYNEDTSPEALEKTMNGVTPPLKEYDSVCVSFNGKARKAEIEDAEQAILTSMDLESMKVVVTP